MEKIEKVTKAMLYEAIKEVLVNAKADEALIDFVDKEVAALAAKAEKAKVRAAEKKAEGDELRAAVEAVLTNELQTGEQILAQIEGEDVTKAKVVARCTALVKAGIAVKEEVKTENGKRVGYKLAD